MELGKKVVIVAVVLTAADIVGVLECVIEEMDREELIAEIRGKIKMILRDKASRYTNLTEGQLAAMHQTGARLPEIMRIGRRRNKIVGFLAGSYYVGTDRELYSPSGSAPLTTSRINLDKLPIAKLRKLAKRVERLS